MKKMMMALCVVIVFSGAFIVYGSGSVNEKRDFYSNFSQSFRSNRITFGYIVGHNTIKGEYIYTTPANGYLKVTMDNKGGFNSKIELTGTDGVVGRKVEAMELDKGENRVFYAYPQTIYGKMFYGYIDYRGASTTPDIYTYEVTR